MTVSRMAPSRDTRAAVIIQPGSDPRRGRVVSETRSLSLWCGGYYVRVISGVPAARGGARHLRYLTVPADPRLACVRFTVGKGPRCVEPREA